MFHIVSIFAFVLKNMVEIYFSVVRLKFIICIDISVFLYFNVIQITLTQFVTDISKKSVRNCD